MPNKMRGLSSASFLIVVNLIGLGLGPTAVAWFTDKVFVDEMMLGYSLVVVGVFAHISSFTLLFFGLKPYRESAQRLDEWEASNT